MNCTAVREALSAQLDGERSAVTKDVIDSHCRTCLECAVWHQKALTLHRQIRVTPAPEVPNLTAAITNATADIPLLSPRGQSTLKTCRILLACCALLQMIATLPTLFGSVHADHELGSWDLALSVGLLFAAIRPERAWGMLPLVGAVTFALGVTAIVDVSTSNTSFAAESSHLVEAIGLMFLWYIAREVRHESTTSPELQPA